MLLMRANPLLGQGGGGQALEISDFFGPQMALACLDAISQGPKKSRYAGSIPSHLPSYWICSHHKHYVRGRINHRSLNSYYGLLLDLTDCKKTCRQACGDLEVPQDERSRVIVLALQCNITQLFCGLHAALCCTINLILYDRSLEDNLDLKSNEKLKSIMLLFLFFSCYGSYFDNENNVDIAKNKQMEAQRDEFYR